MDTSQYENKKEFTAKNTEIVAILDRSGSMYDIINDAIGGINALISKQKQETEKTTMTTILFDDRYDVLYENKDIKEVELFNESTYVPRGATALNDAIGRTLLSVHERHLKMATKKPDNVVVAILTDGHNNASTEFTSEAVKSLIEKYEKVHNYKFIYIAANQDAFQVGRKYGFNQMNSVSIDANSRGIQKGFSCMQRMVNSSRECEQSMDSYALYSQDNIKKS